MTRTGYSAKVEMWLHVQGCADKLVVSHAAPDYLILRTAPVVSSPPVDAVFVLSIDGEAERKRVRLPCGLPAGERRVVIGGQPKSQFD